MLSQVQYVNNALSLTAIGTAWKVANTIWYYMIVRMDLHVQGSFYSQSQWHYQQQRRQQQWRSSVIIYT